jgi:hypothetical protein
LISLSFVAQGPLSFDLSNCWGQHRGSTLALNGVSIPLALFIGTTGAVSVFKAVYLDRRELKCACVGGSSNVPLGFVSLTENLMMVGMTFWMLFATAAARSGG